MEATPKDIEEFLKEPEVQARLRAWMEKKYPPPPPPEGDIDMSRADLEKLLRGARGRNRRYDHQNYVLHFAYRGVSVRGSMVYDINPKNDFEREHRLYVRMEVADGMLRGEVDEDEFQNPRYGTEVKELIKKVSEEKKAVEEPVSAVGQWWKQARQHWKEL